MSKAMKHFFHLIGDWDSLLMLLENAPEWCPSMNPHSLALLIRYKSDWLKGAVLRDWDGNKVLDAFGDDVLCQGGWNAPTNANQLKSAVFVIHLRREQR
jgi:hypothetical protein